MQQVVGQGWDFINLFPLSMSRPLALGLVLLVLFLTSQSDWKATRSQLESSATRLTKQQRTEAHRESIKEKIILDLMGENKRYEGENQRLKIAVELLQRQLSKCRSVPPGHVSNLPPEIPDANLELTNAHSRGHVLSEQDQKRVSSPDEVSPVAASAMDVLPELVEEGASSAPVETSQGRKASVGHNDELEAPPTKALHFSTLRGRGRVRAYERNQKRRALQNGR